MATIRDCNAIWTRLFDHRPFLNGELKFMLREFEEKRSDREIVNLFHIIENVTEIKDNQFNRIKQLVTTNVPLLVEKIDDAIIESEKVLEIEKFYKKNTFLDKKREERKKIWSSFIEGISEKYTRIDNAFEQKEEELKDLYADLEHKLIITTQ